MRAVSAELHALPVLLFIALCLVLPTPPAQGQGTGTYPPASSPPPLGFPVCTQPDGQCLQVEQSTITFPDVSVKVRAVGFEQLGAYLDRLEYAFGWQKVNDSMAEVPDAAQPLLNTSTTYFVTSPKGSSPDRTLVAPGPGVYEAYVCAYNSFGAQACSSAMVSVQAPCPLLVTGKDVLEELNIKANLAATLARGDAYEVLEASFTLAAVLNTFGPESTSLDDLMRLLSDSSYADLFEAIFAALNEVLMFPDSDASVAASVTNAQQALLTRVSPISKAGDTECDVRPVCPRGPGFWKNHPEVWDANSNNDDEFDEKPGWPASDILRPPYTDDEVNILKRWGLLIGDFNRNGMLDFGDESVFLMSFDDARAALSSGNNGKNGDQDDDEEKGGEDNNEGSSRGRSRGNRKLLQGRRNDMRQELRGNLVTVWLNWLAYARPMPAKSIIQEAIKWLKLNAYGDVGRVSFAWIGCDSVGEVRCGALINRDLEMSYKIDCEDPDEGPGPGNGSDMDRGLVQNLAKQCLENVNASLTLIADSSMYELSTLTASSALDSAYGCSQILGSVRAQREVSRRLAAESDYAPVLVLEATLEAVGWKLGRQVPLGRTLVASALEVSVTLGVSVNMDDSMAGTTVALPEPGSGPGYPAASFPDATWCIAGKGACADQSPLAVRVVWSELPSPVVEEAIEAWIGAEEGARNFKIESGVLQVQPTSIAGEPWDGTSSATLSCEGDIQEADCKLQMDLPFTYNFFIFDPRKVLACARLLPSGDSSLTAVIGERILNVMNLSPVTCTSSDFGAYVLVQYERPFGNF